MPLPASLEGRLELPVAGAPLFIVSGPELVIAQCKAGIVGSFPALNARPVDKLGDWLRRIEDELGEYQALHPEQKVAPYAVNRICHISNDRSTSQKGRWAAIASIGRWARMPIMAKENLRVEL